MSKFLDAMTHYERRLLPKIGRARNQMLMRAASVYLVEREISQWVTTLHQQRIERELKGHYEKVIPYFGKLALSQIKRRQKKSFDTLVSQWIAREALRKARMIAATDREEVRSAIQDGMEEGLGIAEIARNIRRVSDSTARRSLIVARTETHAAANYGSIESVREAGQELGVKMLKRWLPTRDGRTRPDHAEMENHPAIPLEEKFNVGGSLMDRPGDPSAPPEQVINCLHPDSVIESGSLKAVTRHWHEGTLLVIKTASGSHLTVTENHPVLTPHGWVAARSLAEGMNVVGSRLREGGMTGDLDVNDVKPTVQQVFDSLAVVSAVVRVSRVDVDFHGDIPQGDVDVVRPAGKLRNGIVASLSKPLDHLRLACTDLGKGRLLANRLLFRIRAMELAGGVSDRIVRFGNELLAFLKWRLCHSCEHSLAPTSGRDVVVIEAQNNGASLNIESVGKGFNGLAIHEPASNVVADLGSLCLGCKSPRIGGASQYQASGSQAGIDSHHWYAVIGRKLRNALASTIFADQVVSISHMFYSGYVYNVETHNGYYICNGIVQHNCRCTLIYEEAE